MNRRGGSACTTAISAVLALAVLGYAAAGLARLFADTPRQSTVSSRSVECGYSADGILIRSEIALEGGEAVEASRIGSGDSMGAGFTSPASGLYFSSCDGYEHLSLADIAEPDAQSIAALIAAPPADFADGRLVTGKYWYFAALLPEGSSLESGARLGIDFGLGEIPCTVLSAGEGFAVLRMDTELAAHAELRHTAANIITEKYSGLAIDPAALRSEGGERSVLVMTAGREEIKTVNILFTAPDFLLVEAENEPNALHEGDIVLISGD